MRKNGFQWPWHPYQICSWLLYVLIVFGSVVLLGQLLPMPFNIIFYIVTAAGEVAVAVLTVMTTAIDPADDMKDTNIVHGHYCYLCKKKVKSSTEHCRPCNKCVAEFDHHCKWLNTCIGKKNYRPFICTLITLSLLCFVLIVVSLVVTILSFIEPTLIDTFTKQFSWPHFSLLYYRISVIVYLVMNIALMYFTMDLLIFHIHLMKEGNTTYSHFKQLERKEKEKELQKRIPQIRPLKPSNPVRSIQPYQSAQSTQPDQVDKAAKSADASKSTESVPQPIQSVVSADSTHSSQLLQTVHVERVVKSELSMQQSQKTASLSPLGDFHLAIQHSPESMDERPRIIVAMTPTSSFESATINSSPKRTDSASKENPDLLIMSELSPLSDGVPFRRGPTESFSSVWMESDTDYAPGMNIRAQRRTWDPTLMTSAQSLFVPQIPEGRIEPWSTTDMRGFADSSRLNSVDSPLEISPTGNRPNTVPLKFLTALTDKTVESEVIIS